MRTRHPRLTCRRNRGSRMTCDSFLAAYRHFPQLEVLELRLLLTTPQILSHNLPEATEESISGMFLAISEPVQGDDVRQSDTYELRLLGPDHAPGGGDDRLGEVLPTYADGSQQIDLQFSVQGPTQLSEWQALPHRDGSAGTWTLDAGRMGITHVASGAGAPAYMVSADELIDDSFEVLTVVNGEHLERVIDQLVGSPCRREPRPPRQHG